MAEIIYLILTVLLVLITYIGKQYAKSQRFWELVNKINGESTLPFIGNAHQIENNSVAILRDVQVTWEKFNRSTFKIVLGNSVFIILSDPECVEVLLRDNKELNKMDDYFYLSDWIGDGLLLSTGQKWRRQRKIITPTFHFKILENFVDVFNEKGKIFIEKVGVNKGNVFDIYSYVTLYALDVISESAMGVSVNAQDDTESDYVRAVYDICQIVHLRTYSSWKRNDFLFSLTPSFREQQRAIKILHATSNAVIQSKKTQLKDEIEKVMTNQSNVNFEDGILGNKKKVAFLDLLLLSKTPEGNPLPEECIREETDTFMFEGHDTTSSGISFTLYLLSNNPEVQAKAFDEQRTLLGDDLSREPNYQDLQEMKYLDLVIKESLRIYPPVPNYGRKLMDDITLPDGTILPGGCLVAVHAFYMHRNPKYYKDPERFWPERFLPENLPYKHPYAFVPFSAGARNCIGQKFAMLEMKSIISKVLRTYELSGAGPGTEPQLAAEIILKSKNGINVRITDRKYL